MTNLFVWLATVVAYATVARASGGCEQFFTTEHFPPSHTWTGAVNSEFSRWAAGVANEAAPRIAAGESFERSLRAIALARRAFGGNRLDQHLGVARFRSPGVEWQTRVDNLALEPRREAMIDAIVARHPKLTADFATFREFIGAHDRSLSAPVVNVRYEFVEASRNEVVTRLHLDAERESLIFTHPDTELLILVAVDVSAQVRRMLREGGSKKDFARALHGYFNAMPFGRGSGAIGRIYFTALHHALFHEAITLVEDIDVRAMSTSPRVFIAQFRRGELIDRHR